MSAQNDRSVLRQNNEPVFHEALLVTQSHVICKCSVIAYQTKIALN
jgi:hypothetical protein